MKLFITIFINYFALPVHKYVSFDRCRIIISPKRTEELIYFKIIQTQVVSVGTTRAIQEKTNQIISNTASIYDVRRRGEIQRLTPREYSEHKIKRIVNRLNISTGIYWNVKIDIYATYYDND